MIDVFVGAAFLATSSSLPDLRLPWTVTAADRIARRLDPAERHARLQRELPSVRRVAPGWSPINGRYEPELFLPSELLTEIVGAADTQAPYALKKREFYREYIARAGWDVDTFWRQLEAAAAPTIALRHEAAAAQVASRGHADMSRLESQACAANAAALAAMRGAFGGTAFDNFLYTAVAPRLEIWTNDNGETADTLWHTERGCK